MIHSVRGILKTRTDSFVVIDVHGIGLKVFTNAQTILKCANVGGEIEMMCHLRVREDAMDLYGFLDEHTLRLFELLNSVSGVGPKSALSLLDLDSVPNITAAIFERKADLLARASGIGKKTAERIVLELSAKIGGLTSKEVIQGMEMSVEVEDALLSLGYTRPEVRGALHVIKDTNYPTMEDKLKAALKVLGKGK